MNRRKFLALGGAYLLFGGVGLAILEALNRHSDAKLRRSLNPLFDRRFRSAATGQDPDHLETRLRSNGVLDDEGGIRVDALRDLASTERLVEFDGRLFTASELDLYSLAYLRGGS